ncbi:hypothetical protein M9H77_16344 [Catharanthus roseus]|uniref:Uncharacterized protein n=1 Tax=Catharanthus roseus TaxID=4058 RepID=A0ACC0B1I5_CATRO|nr:hypothetical protein M9H77_16344 [Catharanthus roseus]
MAITQMVSDEPLMLYPSVKEDDHDNDHSDKDYAISNESDDDNNPDGEEEDISTPVNPSSQWFSGAPYDYTQSRAFLDMGSGEQIDDLIESSTIRLLDWSHAMIDIQLI